MLRTKKGSRTGLQLLLVTTCLSLICLSSAHGQQDETDPQRWGRVKTWAGTFTYTCNDSHTGTLEGITTELTWNDRITGGFTLTSLNSSMPNRYIWNGRGSCSGTINEVTVLTDQEGGSCTSTWTHQQPAPLVYVPGYSLSINLRDGTYFFQAETVQWPVTVNECCDGDCTTMNLIYGNGGIVSSFHPLPASGFSLKGSYNGALQIGLYQLTATITWDIRATEVSPPPPSSCPVKNSTKNQNHLRPLYALRKGLAGSEAGRMVTSLYYEHAPEVSSIVLRTPELRDQMKKIVAIYAASAETAGTNEPVVVSDELIEQTECFLDELTVEASFPLLKAIELARDTIHDRLLLKELGIAVH